MAFDTEQLTLVFEKSGGRCTYCDKQLAWGNYGIRGARGGWEVDHSRPRSNGGSNHMNNLFAACWYCNLDKRDGSRRSFKGYVQPERQRRAQIRQDKATNEALSFGLMTLALILLPRILSALSKNNQQPGNTRL